MRIALGHRGVEQLPVEGAQPFDQRLPGVAANGLRAGAGEIDLETIASSVASSDRSSPARKAVSRATTRSRCAGKDS